MPIADILYLNPILSSPKGILKLSKNLNQPTKSQTTCVLINTKKLYFLPANFRPFLSLKRDNESGKMMENYRNI